VYLNSVSVLAIISAGASYYHSARLGKQSSGQKGSGLLVSLSSSSTSHPRRGEISDNMSRRRRNLWRQVSSLLKS
jgi:hypothetical protein